MRYDKMHHWMPFVTDGSPLQAACLRMDNMDNRIVCLATCYDVMGGHYQPKTNIHLKLKEMLQDGSDANSSSLSLTPIVACPFVTPDVGFVSWMTGRYLEQWARLESTVSGKALLGKLGSGKKTEGYSHLVMAGANACGDSCIVDRNGDKLWFEKEGNASENVLNDEVRLFWRRV